LGTASGRFRQWLGTGSGQPGATMVWDPRVDASRSDKSAP